MGGEAAVEHGREGGGRRQAGAGEQARRHRGRALAPPQAADRGQRRPSCQPALVQRQPPGQAAADVPRAPAATAPGAPRDRQGRAGPPARPGPMLLDADRTTRRPPSSSVAGAGVAVERGHQQQRVVATDPIDAGQPEAGGGGRPAAAGERARSARPALQIGVEPALAEHLAAGGERRRQPGIERLGELGRHVCGAGNPRGWAACRGCLRPWLQPARATEALEQARDRTGCRRCRPADRSWRCAVRRPKVTA